LFFTGSREISRDPVQKFHGIPWVGMGFFPRESLIPWKFHGTASGPKPKKNTFLQLYYTIPHTLLPGDGIETGCPLSQVDLNSWKLEESYDFISKHTTHTYLRVTVFFCLYSFQRWVQGRSDDRVRGVRLQTGCAVPIGITLVYALNSQLISRSRCFLYCWVLAFSLSWRP